MDNTVWPISSFQKKLSNCFELRCTSQNFYPETIRFKSYSPLKYFIQVSTKSSILFSIFIKSCIFFSIYTILNKFESGNTGWSIFSFLKKWLIFVKSMYGSNYVVFSFHFQWFYFEIFLTNASHGQYRLTRILHFNQFLSKTDMIQLHCIYKNLQ